VRLASSRHLFYTTAGQCYCHNAVAILSEFEVITSTLKFLYGMSKHP